MAAEEKRLLLNENEDYDDRSLNSLTSTAPSFAPRELEQRKALEGGRYGSVLSISAVNIPLLESLLRETTTPAPSVAKLPPLIVGSAPVSSSDEVNGDRRRPSRAYSHDSLQFLPELQTQTDQLLSGVESAVARIRVELSTTTSKSPRVARAPEKRQLESPSYHTIKEEVVALVDLQQWLEDAFSRLFALAVRYDKVSETGGAVKTLHTRRRRKSVLEKTIHDLLVDTNAELNTSDGGNLLPKLPFESKIVTSARRYRLRARHVLPTVLLLVVWSALIALTWHTYSGHSDWLVLLRVVRSPLLLVSYAYLIAINLKVWAVFRIDYVTVFRFHADTAPTPRYAFRAAIAFTALFAGIVAAYLLLSVLVSNTEGLVISVGIIMWVFLIAFSLNPIDVFCRSGRFALVRSLGRTIFAPFFKVQFGDGWLGDQLVSLVIVFLDLEYFLCYCIFASKSGPVTAYDTAVCTSNVHFVRPIITILPTTWRFFQCLRSYVDTKNTLHLWNAGKYFTTYPVVVFATAYQPQIVTFASLFNFTFDNVGWVVFFWMLSSLINAIYCFIWDVAFDWKLVYLEEHKTIKYQHCLLKCRSPHFRQSCLFTQTWYFIAIVIDFIFRFLWTLKISLAVVWRFNSDLVFTALNFAEFFRRFVWNFLRVELQWIEIRPKGEKSSLN